MGPSNQMHYQQPYQPHLQPYEESHLKEYRIRPQFLNNQYLTNERINDPRSFCRN